MALTHRVDVGAVLTTCGAWGVRCVVQVPHYRSINYGACMDVSDHSPVTAVFAVGLDRPSVQQQAPLDMDDEDATYAAVNESSAASEMGELVVTDFVVRPTRELAPRANRCALTPHAQRLCSPSQMSGTFDAPGLVVVRAAPPPSCIHRRRMISRHTCIR